MRLFFAEKQSMAEAIANALSEMTGFSVKRMDGCYAVGFDRVTWLNGHVYKLAEPEAYDPRFADRRVEDLPIVPSPFRLVPSTARQLGHVKLLLKHATTFVNSGDAGREGQLLVDELLLENGIDPFGDNVLRLWIKSYVTEEIVEALGSMRSNADYRRLYEAAVCRQRMDWLFGMNLSRLLALHARRLGIGGPVSAGRVQTPTLKLVVDRDKEIETFEPVKHFTPRLTCVRDGIEFKASWVTPPFDEEEGPPEGFDREGRVLDRAIAERVVADAQGQPAVVADVVVRREAEPPPLVHSLSSLQASLPFTAKETLDIAQGLYEKRLITYPRTDSRHLPTAMLKHEAADIVEAVLESGILPLAELFAGGIDLTVKSRVWDDSKVSDHHGIVPKRSLGTEGLTDPERIVLMAVAFPFMANFFGDYVSDSVKVTLECGGHLFEASGRKPVSMGWADLAGKNPEPKLPDLAVGDRPEVSVVEVVNKKTSASDPFTDGTLVSCMSDITRLPLTDDVRKRIKEGGSYGLGTEATRADIIEGLIDRGYLKRERKQTRTYLRSTDLGRDVVALATEMFEEVCDHGLTALWECQLAEIASGTREADAFMERNVGFLNFVVDKARGAVDLGGLPLTSSVVALPGHGDVCPACGRGTLRTKKTKDGRRFLGCDRYKEGCTHAVWPKPDVKPLSGDGEPCPRCGDGVKTTAKITKDGPDKGNRFLACSLKCGWREFPEEGGWKKRR